MISQWMTLQQNKLPNLFSSCWFHCIVLTVTHGMRRGNMRVRIRVWGYPGEVQRGVGGGRGVHADVNAFSHASGHEDAVLLLSMWAASTKTFTSVGGTLCLAPSLRQLLMAAFYRTMTGRYPGRKLASWHLICVQKRNNDRLHLPPTYYSRTPGGSYVSSGIWYHTS